MAYDFAAQLKQGRETENLIRELFSGDFMVLPAGISLQSRGVDFVFVNPLKEYIKVEVKADARAIQTGNAFIETVSCDRENKLGWAHTSEADWLLYVLPGHRIYKILFPLLRAKLPGWEIRFPTRSIPNNGKRGKYNTVGLLVPLTEIQQISEVIELEQSWPYT